MVARLGVRGRAPPKTLVDLALQVRHETALAYLVYDGKQEQWLPKSHVEKHVGAGTTIFTMPEWMAKAKGLI